MRLHPDVTSKVIIKYFKTLSQKFNVVHNHKYDYSKVVYSNSSTKIVIGCPIHGDFTQRPNDHSNGKGCAKCYNANRSVRQRSTLEEFIKKSIKHHGDIFDFTEAKYTNCRTKLTVKCFAQGHIVESTPSQILTSKGCPKCLTTTSTEGFIEKVQIIHGDTYDYSKVNYVNVDTKVKIVCKKHNEVFLQAPRLHYKGQGCPLCANENASWTKSNFKGKRTCLYIIQIGSNLTKVGITTKSIKERFGKECSKFTILLEQWFFDGEVAWNVEKEILRSTAPFRYKGAPILRSGNTELRVMDLKPIAIDTIKQSGNRSRELVHLMRKG